MRCALLLAFAGLLGAQESRFDVGSRLVLVPVTVTDLKGHTINGLQASDFRVLDGGRPRNITVDTIDTGVAPIALAIAVQSSGISAAVLEKVRRIANMIQPLVTGARGCAALVSFDERITWIQECTTDPDEIDRAFGRLRPVLRPGEEKEAHLLDAVSSAVEHLRKRPNSRRVLLLISETRDRGSETALEAAAVAAQSAGVTVYAATYSAFKTAFTSKSEVTRPRRPLKPKTPIDDMGTLDGRAPTKGNPKELPPEQNIDLLGAIREIDHLQDPKAAEVLARRTGGTTFSFTRQKALEDAIQKFGAELHSQYVLSFVPEASPASGYHSLEVRVRRRGEFVVRARPGYWPAGESQQP